MEDTGNCGVFEEKETTCIYYVVGAQRVNKGEECTEVDTRYIYVI